MYKMYQTINRANLPRPVEANVVVLPATVVGICQVDHVTSPICDN